MNHKIRTEITNSQNPEFPRYVYLAGNILKISIQCNHCNRVLLEKTTVLA